MNKRPFRQPAVLMIIGLALTCVSACTARSTVPAVETAPEPVMSLSPPTGPISTQNPMTLAEEPSAMTITVVYDNIGYDSRLRTSWGFSCLVELDESTLLFDAGGDGDVLLHNMSALGLDPLEIDLLAISHIHGDHTGAVGSVLAMGVRPVVYMPHSFPASFKDQVRSMTEVREISDPITIMEGVYSTGELGSDIIEQSLVLDTPEGLVVITGCAHPGIVNTVRRAKKLHHDEIYLVMGGFHLREKSQAELEDIIAELQRLGV
jgi:7,8-dihydropterin-6-yl-methyl-4-(beta-D-ribofuranosyl)aminobenzene 5'-phosphate synthase